MRTIIDHLEAELGLIEMGWSTDADGNEVPVQVALFSRGPVSGTRALATIGLSHHALSLGDRARTVRQELVMLFREHEGERNLPGVVQQVALAALQQHRGYLRGEVLGPSGPLVPGATCEALYVAIPVYFSEGFALFTPESGDPIVLAWLVPITHGEAHLIQRRGWAFFEEQLAAQDPDLLALDRPGIDGPFRD